jgi:hypothetical protein
MEPELEGVPAKRNVLSVTYAYYKVLKGLLIGWREYWVEARREGDSNQMTVGNVEFWALG